MPSNKSSTISALKSLALKDSKTSKFKSVGLREIFSRCVEGLQPKHSPFEKLLRKVQTLLQLLQAIYF